MDNSSTTTMAPDATSAKGSKMNLIIPIVLLLIGIVIGYAINSFLPSNNKEAAETSMKAEPRKPDEKVLTDPSKILSNPIFTEWYGAIRGKVVSKSTNSFTVDFNGNTLEVFIQPAISAFADVTQSNGEPVTITFEQLPVNSTVEGTVTISKGTLTGDLDQKVVANGFSVIEK